MLTLERLFPAYTEPVLLERIRDTNIISVIRQIPDDFSPFKKLLEKILVIDPAERLSIDEIHNELLSVGDKFF